jgi:hypothetical protein
MVVHLANEYAGDCSDHARHLLPVALRRFGRAEKAQVSQESKPSQPIEQRTHPQEQTADSQYLHFDLCKYERFDLHFLRSEGGDLAFSVSLDRSSADSEDHRGQADVFFHIYGEKDSSFSYHKVSLPRRKDTEDHKESIVLSGKGRADFLGRKTDGPVFSIQWNDADNELDGKFEVYDGDNVVQSLAFFQ